MNTQLKKLRTEIDQCDTDLVDLMTKRFTITKKVGELKSKNNIRAIDSTRESEQSIRIANLALANDLNPELLQQLQRTIIAQVVEDHRKISHNNKPKGQTKIKLGIIGMGRFGQLINNHLSPLAEIHTFDSNQVDSSPLTEIMECDWIVLAVPLGSLASVLIKIRPILKSETVLIDVCSVKIKPIKIFNSILPLHPNVVFTHPMFGPQSASNILFGQSILFCNQNQASKRVQKFCEQTLGLNVIHISSHNHDVAMAQMHSLTFFIARGLRNFGLVASQFQAPSFQSLLDLVKLDTAHSQELFETVECGNPFASRARQKLIKELNSIDTRLNQISSLDSSE